MILLKVDVEGVTLFPFKGDSPRAVDREREPGGLTLKLAQSPSRHAQLSQVLRFSPRSSSAPSAVRAQTNQPSPAIAERHRLLAPALPTLMEAAEPAAKGDPPVRFVTQPYCILVAHEGSNARRMGPQRMSNAVVAVALFLPFVLLDQWAFRCQRVGRGILLLTSDGAAALHLLSRLMPMQFVVAVWLARLLWVSSAVFAWRAWGWPSLVGILLYRFVLGSFVDRISPWPSYSRLLHLIRERIVSGEAGFESIPLLLYISRVERQLAEGADFEKVTVGVWRARVKDPGSTGHAL